jgi:hypothetical protein
MGSIVVNSSPAGGAHRTVARSMLEGLRRADELRGETGSRSLQAYGSRGQTDSVPGLKRTTERPC